MTYPNQLPIFAPGGAFADEMERLTLMMHDTKEARILLTELRDPFATPNDPHLLRRESMAELARRLFGNYAIEEYHFAAKNAYSLPRYCRTLAKRPVCVFAYGLEELRQNNPAGYEEALALLNNQRENIRDSHVSVVLFAGQEDFRAVFRDAPDFADWRSASFHFVVPRVEMLRSTPLGNVAPREADRLRREEQSYRELLSRPNLRDRLKLEYSRNLAQVLEQLGSDEEAEHYRAVARELSASPLDLAVVRHQYLDWLIKENNAISPRGITQTERSVTLPLDEVYIALSAERTRRYDTGYPFPLTQREADYLGVPFDWLVDNGFVAYEPKESDGTSALTEKQRNELDKSMASWRSSFTATQESIATNISIGGLVREQERLVCLGDPGAGKTTLLRFLAVQYARALKQGEKDTVDPQGVSYGAPKLPILVRISDFVEARRECKDLTLDEFLPSSPQRCPVSAQALNTLFQKERENAGIVLLLDGLDEITEGDARTAVLREIDRFAAELGEENKLIVTSRIAGYSASPLGAAFEVYRINDMEREQIERFLRRWCLAVEKFHAQTAEPDELERRATLECDALLSTIDANQSVLRLAVNPLLLTILALIHRNGARLPQRRIELYQIAAKTLLQDWRLAQVGQGVRTVEEREVEELLAPLAYYMHRYLPTGLIREERAKAKLAEYLAEARGQDKDSETVHAAVEDFLTRVREQTGLFVERAPGYYGFMHLTFEEYFASLHLTSEFVTAAEKIAPLRHRPRWEEPIRLAIAAQRPKDAAYLIRHAIMPKDENAAKPEFRPAPYEDVLHRDLILAGRCLSDCEVVEPTLAREVAELLFNHAFDSNETRTCIIPIIRDCLDGDIGLLIDHLLLTSLSDDDVDENDYAVVLVYYIGKASSAVIEAILNNLDKAEYKKVELKTIEILSTVGKGNPKVIDKLEQICLQNTAKDRHFPSNVKSYGLDSLYRVGGSCDTVYAQMKELLQSRYHRDKLSAAEILLEMDADHEVLFESIRKALNAEDYFERHKASNLLLLLRLDSAEYEKTLLCALDQVSDGGLYFGAKRVDLLERIAHLSVHVPNLERSLFTILRKSKDYFQPAVIATWRKIGFSLDKVKPYLEKLVNSSDPQVRIAAAQEWGEWKIDIALPQKTLFECFSRGMLFYRVLAARALFALNWRRDDVLNILKRLAQSKQVTFALTASVLLLEQGEVSPEYIELVHGGLLEGDRTYFRILKDGEALLRQAAQKLEEMAEAAEAEADENSSAKSV